MKISAEAVVIVVVTVALATWFSSKYGWEFGLIHIAGLIWALFDENLLGLRSEKH